MNKITGVILSGGNSSRMGTDKALLEINGTSLIKLVFNNLAAFSDTIIISSDNLKHLLPNSILVTDDYKNCGPAGGIYSSLKTSTNSINIICSCDTPFVSPQIFKLLYLYSDAYDVVVPQFSGVLHPLIGIYKKHTAEIFAEALNSKQFVLKDIISKTKLKTVIIEDELSDFNELDFTNINNWEQYNLLTKTVSSSAF